MTAAELLAGVQHRFSVLLVEEPQQHQLLIDALGQYQDLAGVTKVVRLSAPQSYPLPADFLAPIIATSATGDFVPVDVLDGEDGAQFLELDASAVYPVRFTYLVNLRGINVDSYHLPATSIGMIQDYLEVLIAIPNDERMARIQEAGRMDISRIPAPQDREAQLATLREAMKAQRAILPIITIQPF